MQLTSISIITILCYAISGVCFGVKLFSDQRGNLFQWLATGFALIAVLAHSVALHDALPLATQIDLNLFRTIEALCWLMSCLVLTLSIRYPIESLGWVTFSATAIATLAANYLPHMTKLIQLSGTPIQNVHILSSLLAFSLFGVAVLQAGLVSYQRQKLKQKALQRLIRIFPPLDVMESMLFQLLRGGLLLLSLSLVTGYFVLEDMFAQHVAHKVVFSLLAWLTFAALLFGRSYKGWRGKTAVKAVYIGFVLLFLGFIGSKFVLEILIGKA